MNRENRLSPLRFIVAFGVVSMLGDFVYEGARSVIGPYFATLGASATVVGVVTGAGEAVALVFRLFSGRLSDRSGRHWALTIAGYLVTMVSVPLLGVADAVAPASVLVVSERFGKAVRSPARDTMLAEAAAPLGTGFTFGLHELLDQSGALAGPLLVALLLATHHGYRVSFASLAVPAVIACVVLAGLRLAVPTPAAYDPAPHRPSTDAVVGTGFSRRYWQYSAFTAATLAGFATFAVLAYHLQHRHVVSTATIPVVYAVAMGLAGLASFGSGRLYDRFGLRVLVVLPPAGAVIPFLSFSRTAALVWVGALLWGAVMGVHESTMRAAVADLVPRERRGVGYGTFTAVYGLAWLGGAAAIGALYDVSIGAAELFTVVVQVVAVLLFLPLLRPARS